MSTHAATYAARVPFTPIAPSAPLTPVGQAALRGLTAEPRSLPAWLFYDAAGSALFERITLLPEYYPTRTERAIFAANADAIIATAAGSDTLSIAELGAGTATKTGILLAAAVRAQGSVIYCPIDVSASALESAKKLETELPGVIVDAQVADYTTQPILFDEAQGKRLVLYIGSSIGNFTPEDAVRVLRRVRDQLRPGDTLLLGTDMKKDEKILVAAYDDAAGVTAEFNRNVLRRLNRELGADFDLQHFSHCAVWNEQECRMEMYLISDTEQRVGIDALGCELEFAAGDTIHTENSYKFTQKSIAWLLKQSGFALNRQWMDEKEWFAVNLAVAV